MSFFVGSPGVSNSSRSPSPSPRSPSLPRGQNSWTEEGERSMSPPLGPGAPPLVFGAFSRSPSPKGRSPPPPSGWTPRSRSSTPFTEGRPPTGPTLEELQTRWPYPGSENAPPGQPTNSEYMNELDKETRATLALATRGREAPPPIHGLVPSPSPSPPHSP